MREIRETENFLNKFISCHKNSVYWASYMYIRDRAMVSYIKVNLKTNFAVCLVLLECRLILLEHFLTHFLKNKRVFFFIPPSSCTCSAVGNYRVCHVRCVTFFCHGTLQVMKVWSSKYFPQCLNKSFLMLSFAQLCKILSKSQHFPPFKTQKEKLCTDDMCMCPLIYHRRELIKVRE